MKLVFLTLALASTCSFAATVDQIADWGKQASTWQAGQPREVLRELERAVPLGARDSAQRSALEAALASLLQPSVAAETRAFAAQQLAILGASPATVRTLSPLLTRDDSASLVCLALSSSTARQVDGVLVDALSAAEPAARLQIIQALGSRRATGAVGPLQAAAASTPLTQAAIAALGKIGTPAAARALESLSKELPSALTPYLEEAKLTCAAHLAVEREQRTAAQLYSALLSSSHPGVHRGAFLGAISTDRDQGQKRIIEAIEGSDPLLRPVAMSALPRVPALTSWIVKRLPASGPEDQLLLLDALAESDQPAARQAIAEALRAPNAALRAAAIDAMARRPDAMSGKALLGAMLAGPTPQDRRALEPALARFPADEALDAALMREATTAQGETRASLITVLGPRDVPGKVAFFEQELTSTSIPVATAAWKALGQNATEKQLPVMLAKIPQVKNEDLRQAASSTIASAVKRAEHREGIAQQIEALVQADKTLAGDLLPLLSICGDPYAMELLNRYSTDPETRTAALESLTEWQGAGAWEPLAAAYRNAQGAERTTLLRALTAMLSDTKLQDSSSTVEQFRMLLTEARDDAERRLVLGALGGLGHPEALELAQEQLSHAPVKAEAAAAVRLIAEQLKNSDPEAAQAALRALNQ